MAPCPRRLSRKCTRIYHLCQALGSRSSFSILLPPLLEPPSSPSVWEGGTSCEGVRSPECSCQLCQEVPGGS